MRSVTDALQSLFEASQRELEIAQHRAQVMPEILAQGIASLPNELLARILEVVTEITDVNERVAEAVALSHVSKRFRNVALTLPALWNVVSTNDAINVNTMCLSRTTAPGLNIRLEMEEEDQFGEEQSAPILEWFPAVLEHASHWSTFSYDSTGILNDINVLNWLRDSCADLRLPSLHSLHIKRSNASPIESVSHFYSSWTMPMLLELIAANFIPCAMNYATLSICKISLSFDQQWDLRTLLQFLSSLTSLKELWLDLAGEPFSNMDGIVSFPLVYTAPIEKLTVSLFGVDPWFTSHLLRRLLRPSLSTLIMQLTSSSYGQVPRANTDLSSTLGACLHEVSAVNVRSLELIASRFAVYGGSNGTILSLLFDKFPSLKHLAVKIHAAEDRDLLRPYLTPRRRSTGPVIPGLHSLRFEDCSSINGIAVSDLLRMMKRNKEWRKFAKLEVIRCGAFQRSNILEILSMVPKDRIIWKD